MSNQQTPPKYTLQQLQEYIALTKHFLGDVDKIYVDKEVIDWYKSQQEHVTKNIGTPKPTKDTKPEYTGVELVVKVDVK